MRQVGVSRAAKHATGLLFLLVVPLLNLTAPARATPPGTNGLVAFVSGGPSGTVDIWTMLTDGTGRTQVTSTADHDFSPAWSPDGTKIAFVRVLAGSNNQDVWVVNANGSNPVRLTNDPATDEEPAWSPDGTKIVFASNRANPTSFADDLFVMNADGTNETPLTSDPATDRMPDWSPDGTKIAFVSTRAAGFNDIWVMDADGTDPVNLTNTTQGSNLQPAWFPDGSKIAFASDPFTVDSTFDVYTIPAAGGPATQLFDTPVSEFNPAPTPDGSMVFFDTNGPPPTGGPAPAPGFTNVVGCDVPVTTCTSGGDGFDPSIQAAAGSPCPQITLHKLTLPDGVVGQKYGFKEQGGVLIALGGKPPYTFEVADPSTLPPGVAVNGLGFDTVIVSGTPETPGTYVFTILITDSTATPPGPCHGSVQYTINVFCAGPIIAARDFDAATVGVDYVRSNTASGGTPPYTWSISRFNQGKLNGLGIDPVSGSLVGVPRREDDYAIRIKVTDANGCVDFLDRVIHVAPHVRVEFDRSEKADAIMFHYLLERSIKSPGSLDPSGTSSPSHDLRYRAAPLGGEFGRFVFIFKDSTDTKGKIRLDRGFVYCFSAELHSAKGKGYGAETCGKAPKR